MIPVDATGGRRIVHGEGVFIGQYGSERIRLKFVRFGRYAGEVGGFHLCTEPVPESTFGGTVLLPQIVSPINLTLSVDSITAIARSSNVI